MTLGDAIDRLLGGPEIFISHHCTDLDQRDPDRRAAGHRVCLGFYGGRSCSCYCHTQTAAAAVSSTAGHPSRPVSTDSREIGGLAPSAAAAPIGGPSSEHPAAPVKPSTSGGTRSSTGPAARVMGSDASRAVDRFRPDGPIGYRAASMPDAPLRSTRAAAAEDERRYLDGER